MAKNSVFFSKKKNTERLYNQQQESKYYNLQEEIMK